MNKDKIHSKEQIEKAKKAFNNAMNELGEAAEGLKEAFSFMDIESMKEIECKDNGIEYVFFKEFPGDLTEGDQFINPESLNETFTVVSIYQSDNQYKITAYIETEGKRKVETLDIPFDFPIFIKKEFS